MIASVWFMGSIALSFDRYFFFTVFVITGGYTCVLDDVHTSSHYVLLFTTTSARMAFFAWRPVCD